MTNRSPLDDPRSAAFAWARWKRMMRAMALFAAVIIAATLGYFRLIRPETSIHVYIAVALGVGLTTMLTAALMGLMFLSHGTGHDAAVNDPLDDGPDRGSP